MSILRNLAKIKEAREKSKAKEKRCDLDLSISDSASLPQPSVVGEKIPSHCETNLGILDYEAVKESTTKSKMKRGSYQTYSAVERYSIGRHASEHGTASTLRKFKNEHPELKESTVRGIRLKYEEELRRALKEKRDPKSSLSTQQRGRPLMLGKIDLMVQEYLRVCIIYIYSNRIYFTLILCNFSVLWKEKLVTSLSIQR